MAIALTCNGCKTVFDVPDDLVGKTIRCTTCWTQVFVTLPVPKPSPKPRIVEVRPGMPPAEPPGPPPPPPRPVIEARPVRDPHPTDDPYGPRRSGPHRRLSREDEDREYVRRSRRGRERSSPNTALVFGLGALGLIAVLAAGVGIYFIMRGAADSGESALASNWDEIPDPEANGFTIRMPGKPSADTTQQLGFNNNFNGLNEKFYTLKVNGGPFDRYFAGYFKLPVAIPEGQRATALKQVMQGAGQDMVSKVGDDMKVDVETELTQDGYPGREMRVTAKGFRKGAGVFRVVLAGDRAFIVFAGGNNFRSGDANTRKFLDSFKITYKPGESAPPNPVGPLAGRFPPARPGLVPPAPPEDWQAVPNADGFTAEMPGRAFGVGNTWQLSRGGEVYAVDYSHSRRLETMLILRRSHPNSRAIPLHLKMTGESDVTLGEFPGKQLTYASEDGRNAGVFRAYTVGDRTYSIAVAVPDEGADSPKIKRFLDSFKITYQPPNPIAANPFPFQPNPNRVPRRPNNPFGPGMLPPGPGDANVPVMPAPGPAVPPQPPLPGDPFNPGGPPDSRVSLVARLDPFWAVAFAPTKGEVYTIGARPLGTKIGGMLRRYSYPDFKLKGSYQLPNLASKMIVDEPKGLLYVAALTKPEPLARAGMAYERCYGEGPIQVFDLNPLLAGKIEEREDLKPVGTMNPVGKVVSFELAADGQTLFALTETLQTGVRSGYRAKLVAFDTAKRTPGKEIALPEPTRDMTWSADGKQLYFTEWPVGANNVPIVGKAIGVVVIDPVSGTKSPTIPLPGFTNDLTASRTGRLVAAVGGIDRNRLFSVDLNGSGSEEIKGMGVANNGYARFTPSGRKLIVSSVNAQGGVDLYDVDNTPGSFGFRLKSSFRLTEDVPLSGYFRLSPDGSLAVFNSGAVLDVENPAR